MFPDSKSTILAAAMLFVASGSSLGLTADEVGHCDAVLSATSQLVGVVLFEEGSSRLDGPMQKIGSAIGDILSSRDWGSTAKIYVVGHTDRVGSDQFNLDLGRKRAEALQTILATKVNAPFEIVSCGETRLVIQTPDGRPHAHNRRVEVRVAD